MKIKFDKDLLIKHKFWVLLAITVPLVLVAALILITAVSAGIVAQQQKIAAMEKSLKKSGNVGPQVIDAHTKIMDLRKLDEVKVHADAFKAQADLFDFPKAVEDRFNFQHGWFATDIKIVPDWKDAPPADTDDLFHGQVADRDEDMMVVKGAKDKKDAKFYRTFKVKVNKQEKKDGDKELQFTDIGQGDFVAVSYYKSKYFFDPLTANEQNEFERSYLSQIHAILQSVDPLDARGNGTVQLNGWPYKANEPPPAGSKFFTYVPKWKTDDLIYKEAWMAQEDIWVQRELYRIIRAANDSVGKCQYGQMKLKDSVWVNPQAEDKSKPAVFENPYFALKFEWVGDKLFVTAKNQLVRRQKLDVYFRVKFNKNNNSELSTERIRVGGEPLDPLGYPNEARKVEIPLDKGAIQRTGIYQVEQVLTWETAPVKRIDQVVIGAVGNDTGHGHRTFPDGLKPYEKEEKKEEEKKDGMGMDKMKGVGQGQGERANMGFGGNKEGAAKLGVNGVLIDRYLEVSEQSRRIPVGLALIVDQDQIDRVLTAFNNSKLRFLTTQVLLNRYPNSVRPHLVAGGGAAAPVVAPKSNAGQPMGDGPMGGVPGGGGSLSGPPGGGAYGNMMPKGLNLPGGGFPGAMTGGGGPSANSGGDEIENNVEMVIYGIVTLYERYPKRKVVADAK